MEQDLKFQRKSWLVKESAATALRCITGDQERAVHEEAAEMLKKLKDFGRPAWPRELYRTYSKQEKHLHEPALELLVRTGQARRLDNGAVEPTLGTKGGHP